MVRRCVPDQRAQDAQTEKEEVMAAHTGRCFRAWRRTTARKYRQGVSWTFPIRQKVPLALRPFFSGPGRHAGAMEMKNAIIRYAQHNAMVGHRPQGR
jgi:hypothetical protein